MANVEKSVIELLKDKYLLHSLPCELKHFSNLELLKAYSRLLITYDYNYLCFVDLSASGKSNHDIQKEALKQIYKILRLMSLDHLSPKLEHLLDKKKASRIITAIDDKINAKYVSNTAQRIGAALKLEAKHTSKVSNTKKVERKAVYDSKLDELQPSQGLLDVDEQPFIPSGRQIPRTPLKSDVALEAPLVVPACYLSSPLISSSQKPTSSAHISTQNSSSSSISSSLSPSNSTVCQSTSSSSSPLIPFMPKKHARATYVVPPPLFSREDTPCKTVKDETGTCNEMPLSPLPEVYNESSPLNIKEDSGPYADTSNMKEETLNEEEDLVQDLSSNELQLMSSRRNTYVVPPTFHKSTRIVHTNQREVCVSPGGSICLDKFPSPCKNISDNTCIYGIISPPAPFIDTYSNNNTTIASKSEKNKYPKSKKNGKNKSTVVDSQSKKLSSVSGPNMKEFELEKSVQEAESVKVHSVPKNIDSNFNEKEITELDLKAKGKTSKSKPTRKRISKPLPEDKTKVKSKVESNEVKKSTRPVRNCKSRAKQAITHIYEKSF